MTGKVQLVCLAGAGGTGKTSVIGELAKLLEGRCTVWPSIVRSFYAERGVVNEADFLSRDERFRKKFQMELYAHYFTALSQRQLVCETPYLLCDRSLFDHYAYTMYGCRGQLASVDVGALNEIREMFLRLHPVIGYLPYPTPWDEQAADGFRARVLDKDYIVDALIYKGLVNSRAEFYTLPFDAPEMRAKHLCRVLSGA